MAKFDRLRAQFPIQFSSFDDPEKSEQSEEYVVCLEKSQGCLIEIIVQRRSGSRAALSGIGRAYQCKQLNNKEGKLLESVMILKSIVSNVFWNEITNMDNIVLCSIRGKANFKSDGHLGQRRLEME